MTVRVLVAERDRYAAEFAEFFLRTEGYQVALAFDAAAAEQVLAEQAPQLVVVEWTRLRLARAHRSASRTRGSRLFDPRSPLEGRPELTTRDHADRAVADVHDELAVGPPEAALELVRPDHESVLP